MSIGVDEQLQREDGCEGDVDFVEDRRWVSVLVVLLQGIYELGLQHVCKEVLPVGAKK